MLSVYAISLLLIGLSGMLLDMHRRSWQAAQQDTSITERDRQFARAQHRRRTQTSAIIGVIGAAIGVWPLVQGQWMMLLYVAALGGAVLWIVLLAALDAWATRHNFARLRSEQLAAQVKLARELSRDDG